MDVIHNKIPTFNIIFYRISGYVLPANVKFTGAAAKFSLPKSAIYEILSLIK